MRKFIVLTVILLGLNLCSAYAQDTTSRRALAEELLKQMNVQDTINKSFEMIKQMIPAQLEKIKQATGQTDLPPSVTAPVNKIFDEMAQELQWEKLKDDYITLYAETFTEEELRGIIAFYKSPAGQAFQQKQPELMRRSMELSQQRMVEIMPKIQAILMDMKGSLKIPAYMVIQTRIRDAALYEQYIREIGPLVAEYGGRFLVRGGKVTSVGGGWNPERMIILAFPSEDQAKEWLSSAEYREISPLREKSSYTKTVLLEGFQDMR